MRSQSEKEHSNGVEMKKEETTKWKKWHQHQRQQKHQYIMMITRTTTTIYQYQYQQKNCRSIFIALNQNKKKMTFIGSSSIGMLYFEVCISLLVQYFFMQILFPNWDEEKIEILKFFSLFRSCEIGRRKYLQNIDKIILLTYQLLFCLFRYQPLNVVQWIVVGDLGTWFE